MQNPGPTAGSSPPPSRSQRGLARRRRQAERAYGILFVLTALVVVADVVFGGRLWHDLLAVVHRIP